MHFDAGVCTFTLPTFGLSRLTTSRRDAMDAVLANIVLISDQPGRVRDVRASLLSGERVGLPRFELLPPVSPFDEGLASSLAKRVDVVLIDLAGGAARGLELLARLQAEAPDVPVVALTGSGARDEAIGIQAVQAGAQDYLVEDDLDARVLTRILHYAIERRRLRATFRELSLTDELTGLYNRRGFLALSEHHRKLVHRTRGLLLASADVAGLGSINERFGRAEGDRALVRAAQVLRQTFRASDVVARLDGDDFAVLVLDAADEATQVIVPRLRARLAQDNSRHAAAAYTLELRMLTERFAPDETPPLEDLLERAGEALRRR
jgi:two-component system, cell cycle response regulator